MTQLWRLSQEAVSAPIQLWIFITHTVLAIILLGGHWAGPHAPSWSDCLRVFAYKSVSKRVTRDQAVWRR